MRNIRGPKSRFEAAKLIEAMDAGVFAPSLKQDVVAVPCPGFGEGGLDHGASMTKTAEFGMCDHILEKGVRTSTAEQIWCRYQHAARYDSRTLVGNEDSYIVARQRLGPDFFGLWRLGW